MKDLPKFLVLLAVFVVVIVAAERIACRSMPHVVQLTNASGSEIAGGTLEAKGRHAIESLVIPKLPHGASATIPTKLRGEIDYLATVRWTDGHVLVDTLLGDHLDVPGHGGRLLIWRDSLTLAEQPFR